VLQHFLLKQQTVPACHCGEQYRNSRWITLKGIQEDAVMVYSCVLDKRTLKGIQEDAVMVYSCVLDKRNPEGLVPLL